MYMVKVFGIKGKRLARFGTKFMKSAPFGLKGGGKMVAVLGTATGSPQVMGDKAKGVAIGDGIQKVRQG